MSHNPLFRVAVLLVACTLLGACSNKSSFSVTGNVPAQYSHVWITVNEMWINTNRDADPDDAGWVKFNLSSSRTFDLVDLADGTLLELVDNVDLPSGTYTQLRLFLADAQDALTSSAEDAGLRFNNEVDSFDAQGVAQRLPLRLANSERGIGIVMSFSAITGGGALLDADSPSSDALSSKSSAIIDFDAARDLTPFVFSDEPGYFLNPHLVVIDRSDDGTIQGQVDVSGIATDPNTDRRNVQVSAEKLSEDGSRHVIVQSAPLRSDGSFALYPLSTAADDPTTYDLVFHGPQVRTVIVKSVPVSEGGPDAAAEVALTGLTLTSASSFEVNLSETTPLATRGARIGFYQTPPGSDEVPYAIYEKPVDPFNGRFATDQALSAGDLAIATFTDGTPITIEADDPAEGAGTYTVAALAEPFEDGALDHTVNAENEQFIVSEPAVPAAASARQIGFTFDVTQPTSFDRGQLIVSRNGTIASAASLDPILAEPQSPPALSIEGLPAAVYFAEVWVWNSNDPADTLERQSRSAAIDVRSDDANDVAIVIE